MLQHNSRKTFDVPSSSEMSRPLGSHIRTLTESCGTVSDSTALRVGTERGNETHTRLVEGTAGQHEDLGGAQQEFRCGESIS